MKLTRKGELMPREFGGQKNSRAKKLQVAENGKDNIKNLYLNADLHPSHTILPYSPSEKEEKIELLRS